MILNRKSQFEKSGIIVKNEEDEIYFIAPFSRGVMHFWNQYNAIEENIYDLNQNIVYHLSYEVESIEQVLNLLVEFNQNLLNPRLKRKKILITCQTKQTARIWAGQLHDIAVAFNIDFRFFATEIYNVRDDAYQYDLIILTPQVKYLEKAVKNYSDTPVLVVNSNHEGKGAFLELFHKIQSILN